MANEERPDVPEGDPSDPLDAPYPEDADMTDLGKAYAWANDRSESRLLQTLSKDKPEDKPED